MNRPADMSAPIAALVDAHVHLYAMYDRERFFSEVLAPVVDEAPTSTARAADSDFRTLST